MLHHRLRSKPIGAGIGIVPLAHPSKRMRAFWSYDLILSLSKDGLRAPQPPRASAAPCHSPASFDKLRTRLSVGLSMERRTRDLRASRRVGERHHAYVGADRL